MRGQRGSPHSDCHLGETVDFSLCPSHHPHSPTTWGTGRAWDTHHLCSQGLTRRRGAGPGAWRPRPSQRALRMACEAQASHSHLHTPATGSLLPAPCSRQPLASRGASRTMIPSASGSADTNPVLSVILSGESNWLNRKPVRSVWDELIRNTG